MKLRGMFRAVHSKKVGSMTIKNRVGRRRVTAQDVADLAGVSRYAVSRAFTLGGYVESEKRQRIHKAAEALGYRPNALASGLQGGRSDLVAIFVGEMPNEYDKEVASQLVIGLNTAGKWPIVIGGSEKSARDAVSNVLRYPLEAMILRSGSMDVEIVTDCIKLGIPVISSGRVMSQKGVDNICIKNAEGAAKLTRLLIDNGRRRIGYIGGADGFWSSIERRRGVLDVLSANGLSLVAEANGNYTMQQSQQVAADILDHRPDAIICANDVMAIGAIGAIRERGLVVPQHISVVGFDDIAIAAWSELALTTIRNPVDQLVRTVVDLLERRSKEPNKPEETIFLDAELVIRGSH